jgi:6-pyruvoyltetrahydropterin/6-carboxytetrahydropterin synthase
MARVRMGRVYHFSAAHRLHSPYLSDAENTVLYRDCNNPGGHGHNYVLEVMVEGEMDAKLGMVMDLGELDRLVQEHVLDRLDHQFIGSMTWDETPDQAFISTSESVTYVVWSWLESALPAHVRLHHVHLEETRSNFFDYQGEDHPGRASA